DILGANTAQIGEDTAMNNAEQRLVRIRRGEWQPGPSQRLPVERDAARLPAVRAFERARGVLVAGAEWRQFVEAQDDVGANALLDLDAALGREQVLRPVDVRAEDHAFLGHLHHAWLDLGILGWPAPFDLVGDAAVDQAEHLEPA